jgi:hypothetical protein
MDKKIGDVTMLTGSEEIIAVNNVAENEHPAENRTVSVKQPDLQERVNLIIHEWLTDMWLLTTGEHIDIDADNCKKHNGRPLAIMCGGQMRLVESKFSTLDALRTVGIEMS